MTRRITGIGGIFFKSENPEQLYAWYEKHLGFRRNAAKEAVVFPWRAADKDNPAETLFSLFPKHSQYFERSFMLNYRVEDLDAMVDQLQQEGVEILGRQDYDYGRFAWVMDPEGNRIELWEPKK